MSQGFLGFPIFSFEIPGNDNSHHKQETVSSSATGLRLETSDSLGFECGSHENLMENINLF